MKLALTSLFKTGYLGDIIALIAGVLLVLSFAPYNITTLAFISPALLLATWLTVTPRRAFFRGWLFGCGFYGFGISWVYISLHVYGSASVFFAGLTTILLIMGYALFPAVQGYVLNRFFPRNNVSKLLLAFPATWVLSEWIRSWLFTGFPWIVLGYSQIYTPLRGIAPVFGIFGVTLVVAIISGALVALFYFPSLRLRIRLVLFCILIFAASALLATVQWTHSISKPLKVSLVQGNVPQQLKWQTQEIVNILTTYAQLTEQHLDSDIIVWPECAVVITNVNAQQYIDQLAALTKQHHTTLIMGIPIYSNNQYYNGMLAIGDGNGSYYKHHLLPFGDYIPLRSVFDIFGKYVQIPMSDWSRGAKTQPDMIANGYIVAPFICYEIVFSRDVLRTLPKAQLLLSASDDSWFGDSIAADQHLEMGQMRALEMGRYLLFSTNNGITAIVNPQGELQAVAPRFKKYVLTGEVYAMAGSTPYVIVGIYPIIIFAALLLLLAFFL